MKRRLTNLGRNLSPREHRKEALTIIKKVLTHRGPGVPWTRQRATLNLARGMRSVIATRKRKLYNNTPWEKFVASLANRTARNKNLKFTIKPNFVELRYGNKNVPYNSSFVEYVPSENGRGAYIQLGETGVLRRGMGEGRRLRRYGVHAAMNAGIPLYHWGLNVANLVDPGAEPISTRIVRGAGAVPTKKIPGMPAKPWLSLVIGHPHNTRYKKRPM